MNGIAPNKAMRRRHDIIREIGCILCLKAGMGFVPTQIHHINGSKTQERHAETLGLCYGHHMGDQQHKPTCMAVSRHPNKRAFINRYGKEEELLEYQDQLIKEYENG